MSETSRWPHTDDAVGEEAGAGGANPADVAGFRRAQRVAYDAAVEVAAGLVPGVTEREAASRLRAALDGRGVDRYFHVPFAWFGERSKLAGMRGASHRFFPGRTRLEPGAIAILDVAPVVDRYTADIGYTFRAPGGGPDERLDRAFAALREIRDILPGLVARGDTMRSIYVRVERMLRERGFDNRHARYPFGVLGHRVERMPERRRDPVVAGFGATSLLRLLGGQLRSRLPSLSHRSPLWGAGPDADHPVDRGMWAIEPHLGGDGFGAKFEEILVVEHRKAYWLDDDVPHVTANR
jgi:Xaa-Pro aminopeptidase